MKMLLIIFFSFTKYETICPRRERVTIGRVACFKGAELAFIISGEPSFSFAVTAHCLAFRSQLRSPK